MKREQLKQKDLSYIIRFSMLLIILLQIIITIVTIGMSGTKAKLDSSAEKILENTVVFKSLDLEDKLLKFSDLKGTVNLFNSYIMELENTYGSPASILIKNKKIREQILNQSTDNLLETLRRTGTTGSFIILQEGISENKKSALYLRDLNPENTPSNNYDILVEAGGGEEILKKGFTLDTEWTMELPLGEERSFFDKPMEAVKLYPGLDNSSYGYFSTTFRLRENDIKIMTYTIPLIDERGETYGVMGVEINMEYFKKFLPNKEIGVDDEAAFLFGILSEKGELEKVALQGSHFQIHIGDDAVSVKENSENFYDVDFANKENDIIAYLAPLHLYDSNTPFSNEQWVLAGLVHSDVLYQSSLRLLLALLAALVLSLIISITGAVGVTAMLTKPIKNLMKELEYKNGKKVSLPKTKICEIDELAREIERLNVMTFKEASKLANIIEVSNLPLGVFELKDDSETVFCTKQVFTILQMPIEYWKDNYVRKEDFEREYGLARKELFEENKEDSVFRLIKNGEEKFIRFRISEDEKRSMHIIMDVTGEMQEKQIISHDRDYDILTNLYNRRAFSREMKQILDKQDCSKAILSVWDLDNLKYINDTYGHDLGDKYICLLAEVFIENKGERFLSGRISGDEFMIFSYKKDREENYEKINQIHKAFLNKKMLLPDGKMMAVSASAGTVECGTDGITYEEMVRYADFAMYEAKKKDKGSLRIFSKDDYFKDYILIMGVGELNRILKEEDVRYAFQPIFDIKEGTIFAYEALMRPNSSILMRPDELLRVAAVQSKLKQIEVLTWYHALEEFAALCPNKELKVFINSLPDQCLSEADIQILEIKYKDWMQQVVIEVTEESQRNSNYEEIKRECRKRWKAQMALDDFGSGYSNTEFLVSKEMDYVKLDRGLIQNIQQDQSRQKLIGGIIEFCHVNNVKIIAEGVETAEEYVVMKQLDCDYVQGYYLAKPEFRLLEMTSELKEKILQSKI